MHYIILYSCVSHIGKARSINQDNFICDNRYMEAHEENIGFPLSGITSPKKNSLFGIFDGMGGEECGEIASYIAAKKASALEIGRDAVTDLLQFCQKANTDICDYANENEVSAMGTTAAMLAFTNDGITLCNIGDSKIFRFSDDALEQISKDHVTVSAFGMKPPLSQNLGIPPTELVIDPYFAQGTYNDKDVYLICSDGLTDMVTEEEITRILSETTFDEVVGKLLNTSLQNGGKDNISIILCKIERRGLLNKLFRSKNTKKGD